MGQVETSTDPISFLRSLNILRNIFFWFLIISFFAGVSEGLLVISSTIRAPQSEVHFRAQVSDELVEATEIWTTYIGDDLDTKARHISTLLPLITIDDCGYLTEFPQGWDEWVTFLFPFANAGGNLFAGLATDLIVKKVRHDTIRSIHFIYLCDALQYIYFSLFYAIQHI